jgi:hypothetical protein
MKEDIAAVESASQKKSPRRVRKKKCASVGAPEQLRHRCVALLHPVLYTEETAIHKTLLFDSARYAPAPDESPATHNQ